jgi:hypothetical protein
MRERDLRNLRHLLHQVMRTTGWQRRRLEDKLGVGHGNLDKLLDGTLDLRVRHVLALAELFEVRPGRFFDIGCPELNAAARRDVEDLLSPGHGAIAAAVAERRAAGGEELEERIGKVLRRELERLGLGRRDEPSGGGAGG